MSIVVTPFAEDMLIATRNAGKIRELSLLLADLPIRLHTLAEFPHVPVVEETGATFEENAVLKARFFAAHTGLFALADDSGLEVEALGGAPGIFSARYAGSKASDAERNAYLLARLGDLGAARRGARFVCAIAIADSSAQTAATFVGTCEGRISHAARGTNGFGYDPIFIPDDFEQTLAELPAEVKQRISHRARALAAAHGFLRAHHAGRQT